MSKEIRIFTMQDILETVTDENIDRFMKDLDRFVRDLSAIKEALPDIKTDGFQWIDDGTTNDSIIITTSDNAKVIINAKRVSHSK